MINKEETSKIAGYYFQVKRLANGIKSSTKERAEKFSKDLLAVFLLAGVKSFKSISKLPDSQKEKVLELTKKFREDIYNDIYQYVLESNKLSLELNDDLGWEYISMTDNGIKEYMERTYGGETTKQRINTNTNRFRAVVEVYLANTLLSIKTNNIEKITDEVQKKIWNNISSPYNVSFIPPSKQKHYGRGYATNGISQLYVIEQQMILGIFNEANYNSWKNIPNFKGWRTAVTSKNPCQFCIDEQYRIHTDRPKLPFHAHCLCILYPVFNT